jgi:hypothetical protein
MGGVQLQGDEKVSDLAQHSNNLKDQGRALGSLGK